VYHLCCKADEQQVEKAAENGKLLKSGKKTTENKDQHMDSPEQPTFGLGFRYVVLVQVL